MGRLTRRALLTRAAPAAGASAVAGAALLRTPARAAGGADHGGHGAGAAPPAARAGHARHPDHATFRGTVDDRANGFDPHLILRDFDEGTVSRLPGGGTLREWTLVAREQDVEVAPGVTFPAWSYNGRIPGPTLRATEGDRVRITLVNASSHPHTIHFHGIHPAAQDGVGGLGAGLVQPGGRTVYDFVARPFGLFLYHCHVRPLAEHIAKGLYGTFIVDPKEPREEADELVMVLNGFDTNFDAANEVYAANSIGFAYMDRPIQVARDELVRMYIVNVLEYDLINSFHLHGNMFDWFPNGTRREPTELTDTVMLCQGQRGIAEVRFPYTGRYMFHAHQSEFTELGWQGFIEVCARDARGLICELP